MNNIGHEGTNELMNFSWRENWSKVAALEKMYNNAIKRRQRGTKQIDTLNTGKTHYKRNANWKKARTVQWFTSGMRLNSK